MGDGQLRPGELIGVQPGSLLAGDDANLVLFDLIETPVVDPAWERVVALVVRAAVGQGPGIVQCADAALIDWAANDPDLDFPPPPEEP